MKTQLMTQVMNSTFEVMETMFYLTLEEWDRGTEAPEGPGPMKTAAVTFSGSFSGTILLSIPEPLLTGMTENFLGQDIDTLTPAHVEGTLKEALNMIAGSALTRVDNTAYMGLGIPQIAPAPGPGDPHETVILTTDKDILMAHVKLDPPVIKS